MIVIMPIMGGIETYRELHKKNPDVRVLFYSGYNEGSEIAEIQKEKPDKVGIISQPYMRENLIKAILSLMYVEGVKS